MQQATEFFQGSAVPTMKYSIGDFDRDVYRREESSTQQNKLFLMSIQL